MKQKYVNRSVNMEHMKNAIKDFFCGKNAEYVA